MKTKHSILSLSSICLLFMIGQVLQAQIISVNISFNNTGNTAIDGEETFGVAALDTVVGGWNNIGWTFENLLLSDGTESPVNLEVGFFNDRNYFGPGYINTPLNYGAPHYAATNDDPGTNLTFNNLRDVFPEGYYIIAYVSGFAANPGEGFVTDGRTSYYFTPPTDNKTVLTPENILRTTVTQDPGSGNFPEAHYAVFGSKEAPIFFPFITIRVDTVDGGAVSICGVQIVSASDVVVKTDWAGYTIDPDGYVDTGDAFMGLLNYGTDPAGMMGWLYSVDVGEWLYIPEAEVVPGTGGWAYMNDPSELQLTDWGQGWYFSYALNTWVFAPGETLASSPAWVYAVDMSM
ncbi:hypothetical protein G0Q06_04325 [Puniceicoccales bacterium CK1056]|uniref:Uncharacterized protein n=1 Tax=Oceanipulchritudo coccoides TaxID=2706888 RepID=A0A6B2M033_9BACT|nr:hypothetical protein [Oceanipulchritudo coccoides]NDV61669.1 hypothetical protein [Oceanipulchritudo coccoides]